MGTTPAPQVTEVRWLGGRVHQVEDLRTMPGPYAFLVQDEGRTLKTRVLKGSSLELEIAKLVDK